MGFPHASTDVPGLVRELGLEDSVELPGESSDVKGEMCRASILAMTSTCEGFSMAILEGLSCGLPAISYDIKYGPREIVRDKIDGFIVENRNREQYKQLLIKLAEDVELRRTMSKNGVERAKEFDVKVIADRWMQNYNQLLATLPHRKKKTV